MTIKYAEQTAYVKGESENSMVLKVNDVSDSTLKQGQKAQIMSHLKNSNYKMTYENTKSPAGNLDNANVIYNTTSQELQQNTAK